MRKYKEVMAIMDEQKIDAILVSNGYNMRYLSGFAGATGYFYITKNHQVLLTDARYTIAAKEETALLNTKLSDEGIETGPAITVIEISSNYNELLAQLIAQDGTECLGFEDEDILYADFMKLQQQIQNKKNIRFIPLGGKLARLRAVKTKEELALMKEAEHIGDLAFTHILDVIKPGITELEIAAELAYVMQKNGAEGLSFETIVASGVHSSMPHAGVTAKKIEIGDFVTMDFGCRYQGYCSDMTRTVVVGKASKKQKEIYNLVLRAQLAALDFIKAGYKGCEVDRIAREIIAKDGYGDCFGHGLGHSVGLFIHEEPRLSKNEESLILENMVETIEPGVYIEGFGGVRIEDMVAVTKDGCINFAHSPKELIELG